MCVRMNGRVTDIATGGGGGGRRMWIGGERGEERWTLAERMRGMPTAIVIFCLSLVRFGPMIPVVDKIMTQFIDSDIAAISELPHILRYKRIPIVDI